MRDNATIQSSHQQLRALFSEWDIGLVVSQLHHLEGDDNLPDKVKKEYVKVYGILCEVYGVVVFDYFERILVSLMRKVRFATEVAEVVGVMTQLLEEMDYNAQVKYVEVLLQKLTALQNQAAMGACIQALVRGLSRTMLEFFEEFLVGVLLEKIAQSKHKVQLMEALLSLMLGLEEEFSSKNRVLPALPALIKH